MPSRRHDRMPLIPFKLDKSKIKDPAANNRVLFVATLRQTVDKNGNCNWGDVRATFRKLAETSLTVELLNSMMKTKGKTKMELLRNELRPILIVVDEAQGNIVKPKFFNTKRFVSMETETKRHSVDGDSAANSQASSSPPPSSGAEDDCEGSIKSSDSAVHSSLDETLKKSTESVSSCRRSSSSVNSVASEKRNTAESFDKTLVEQIASTIDVTSYKIVDTPILDTMAEAYADNAEFSGLSKEETADKLIQMAVAVATITNPEMKAQFKEALQTAKSSELVALKGDISAEEPPTVNEQPEIVPEPVKFEEATVDCGFAAKIEMVDVQIKINSPHSESTKGNFEIPSDERLEEPIEFHNHDQCTEREVPVLADGESTEAPVGSNIEIKITTEDSTENAEANDDFVTKIQVEDPDESQLNCSVVHSSDISYTESDTSVVQHTIQEQVLHYTPDMRTCEYESAMFDRVKKKKSFVKRCSMM